MKRSKKMRKLMKAAVMGKAPAMYRLGLRCEQGRECKVNPDAAAIWIEASADAGYQPAADWMKSHR